MSIVEAMRNDAPWQSAILNRFTTIAGWLAVAPRRRLAALHLEVGWTAADRGSLEQDGVCWVGDYMRSFCAGYGAHVDDYPTAYITVAAAIGMTIAEADTLCTRLEVTIKQFKDRVGKARSSESRTS